MIKAIATTLFILGSFSSIAQESSFVHVNTLSPESGIHGSGFMYPDFVSGKVIFKDGATGEAGLNYSYLLSNIYFISPKGDTLVLANSETIAAVTIKSDTFWFHQNAFVKKLSHNAQAPNLFVKQSLKYTGYEKKGPYGTYSSTSAANSSANFSADDQITTFLAKDENIIYKMEKEYFISDGYNNLHPAKKPNFFKAFPQWEQQLKNYLKEHKIDFRKADDLGKILSYIAGMNSSL